MAYEGLQNGDVRAPLALSQAEAREGTTRTLNLPGGQQVVVPVPPGAYNGQEIRLEGQGQPSAYGGSKRSADSDHCYRRWREFWLTSLSPVGYRLPNRVHAIPFTGRSILRFPNPRFSRSGRSIHPVSLSRLPTALLCRSNPARVSTTGRSI